MFDFNPKEELKNKGSSTVTPSMDGTALESDFSALSLHQEELIDEYSEWL